ncbi:DNA polymerase III subunit gamma/tau [Brevibacillus antibioticus]|uniref:DNA polymerase III subunit gamma/tau n=1 Tax=Brevibacillus antibioticus TaxID=2570228 RepID=A0A4U2Y3K1_9BACL|nr:DNA polymerase III subunit gamma/tau [Brevibacillus antibioticus]TKI54989.1 DNA polymerase III subunit gamma/tau [Brevibacillus antibioticus]
MSEVLPMRKQELLFGFGAGLIVATSIIGLLAPKQTAQAPALTVDQMKVAAQELEMVVLTAEEYKQWQEEKKVNVQPAPSVPKAPVSPKVGQTVAPVSKQPQTPTVQPTTPAASAEQKVIPPTNPGSKDVQPTSTVPNTQTPTSPNTVAPKAPTVEAPVVDKKVSFTVPYKATAEDVAQILVKEGVLPAENQFVAQLRASDKLNRIRVGTYEVSTASKEADIVKLITTPPKK